MPAEIEIIVFWVLEIAFLLFIIIGFTKRICSKKQSSKKSKENLMKNIFEDEKTPIDCNISSLNLGGANILQTVSCNNKSSLKI